LICAEHRTVGTGKDVGTACDDIVRGHPSVYHSLW